MVVSWCWTLMWLLQICFKAKTKLCHVICENFCSSFYAQQDLLQLAAFLKLAQSQLSWELVWAWDHCFAYHVCLWTGWPLITVQVFMVFFFTFFILRACVRAQLRQWWTIFICEPHDFLTNGLSQWFRPLVSLYLVQSSVLHINLFWCIYSDNSLSLLWHHQ